MGHGKCVTADLFGLKWPNISKDILDLLNLLQKKLEFTCKVFLILCISGQTHTYMYLLCLQAYPHVDRAQGGDQQCPVQLRLFPHSHWLYGQDVQDLGNQPWYLGNNLLVYCYSKILL